MADEGHNEACAKASSSTPCTCPCKGAKHSEGMTAFRRSRVSVPRSVGEGVPESEYSTAAQRLVGFADAMQRHRERRSGDPFAPKVDVLGEFNRIGATPRERFDELSPADRARVNAGLDTIHASYRTSAEMQNRIAGATEAITGRQVPRAVVPPPRHVQEVLDVVEGRRRTTVLPASMAYAQISRDQYERHFTPEQRARIAGQLRDIRSRMSPDARDRPGVERVLADLDSIDRTTAVQVRSTPRRRRPASRVRTT